MDAMQLEHKLPATALLTWFDAQRRTMPWRSDTDPYRIWVSEVMLQQTRVETVIPYFERFTVCFPDLKTLARAHPDAVLRLWQGLGYYQRAHNLHRAACLVLQRHNGRIPDDWQAFRALPGVGDYIAAAVLSIAFNRPHAVLDGNVIRVASRFWGIRTPVFSVPRKRWLRERIEKDMTQARSGDFNQAMMELGAIVCKSRAWLCRDCPLNHDCFASMRQLQHQYPQRRARPVRPLYTVALAVIRDGRRILIQKRKADGHLGGLWEFPGGKLKEGESPDQALIRECREEIGCDFEAETALPPFRHVYTHFEIEVHAFIGRIVSGSPQALMGQPLHWLEREERENFAFPAANQRIFRLLDARS